MDNIKGVFFDLHGTLLLSDDIDSAWDRWAHAFHEAILEKGANLSFDEFKKLLQNLFEGPEPDYYENEFSLFMRRVKQLSEELEIDLPNEEIRPLVDSIIRIWHDGMYLDEEVKSVIEKLSEDYKVGLVTNWEHSPRIFELLRELDADELFDCVVVSDDVGHAKPNPHVFRPAFNLTDVSAEDAIYVGDMDVDVEAALKAGMKPVLIKREDANGDWGQYTQTGECNYSMDEVIVIQKLSQLFDVLNC